MKTDVIFSPQKFHFIPLPASRFSSFTDDGVNVHAFRYEAGRQKLEFIGKGSFVILGVVPSSVKLEKRGAGKGTK